MLCESVSPDVSLLENSAPDFTLDSTTGGTTTLSETTESGPTVLLLNRGVWCSYCAEQLQTFSELSYDMWRHQNVDIYGIMGDPVPDLVEMRDRFDLSFQLLSDPNLDVAESYTAVEDNAYHGRIPIAGTFIVDTNGIVRYEQVATVPADRTYANYVRHLIKNEYEPPYDDFGSSGGSVQTS